MKPLWHRVTVRYLQGVGLKNANEIVKEAYPGFAIRKIRKDAGVKKKHTAIGYDSLRPTGEMGINNVHFGVHLGTNEQEMLNGKKKVKDGKE